MMHTIISCLRSEVIWRAISNGIPCCSTCWILSHLLRRPMIQSGRKFRSLSNCCDDFANKKTLRGLVFDHQKFPTCKCLDWGGHLRSPTKKDRLTVYFHTIQHANCYSIHRDVQGRQVASRFTFYTTTATTARTRRGCMAWWLAAKSLQYIISSGDEVNHSPELNVFDWQTQTWEVHWTGRKTVVDIEVWIYMCVDSRISSNTWSSS